MMDEMKEMRLEVGKLHDKGIRARCSQLADTVEGKVHQTKVMVSTAKENLISSAKQMVQTFREKGRSALCHAAQALHIPSVLSRMGRGFAHSEKSMGQLAVRLDSMREELHQAGGHIKNAGLALTGKEPQESKELSADKGVLAKLRSFVLSCGKVFSEMERDMALTVCSFPWAVCFLCLPLHPYKRILCLKNLPACKIFYFPPVKIFCLIFCAWLIFATVLPFIWVSFFSFLFFLVFSLYLFFAVLRSYLVLK